MRKFLCLLIIVAMVAFSGCLVRDIASGPDRPDALDGSGEADGLIDLVLPAPGTEPSTYSFIIEWGRDNNESYPPETPIMICDTVPVEWQVVQVITFGTVYEVVDGVLEDANDGLDGTINVFPANKKNGGDQNKSATKIEYTPNVHSGIGNIKVVVTTRERPQEDGGNATIKWAPTFCGRLYLNDGAIGYEIDENGDLVLDAELNPVVLEEQTDPLFVVAVFDVDGDGIIVRDGSGDEDEDGVVDGEDNCPCVDNPDQVDMDDDGIGGACEAGAEARLLKESAVEALSALLPTGDKKTDHRIEKAIKNIQKSLANKLWQDDSHLTKKGKKVFVREKKAVKELMKIKNGPDVSEVITSLITADTTLAQIAIDDAVEASGDAKKIAKAEKQMTKAQNEIDSGKYDKAIHHYKKAWEHAKKAMKKMIHDDDDDQEDDDQS